MAANIFGNSIVVPAATGAIGFGPDEVLAVKMSTGTGNPPTALTHADGSIYLRSDATGVTNALWVMINGTWTVMDGT